MQSLRLNPYIRFANIVSLKLDYPRPLLAYDHRLVYLLDGRMRVEFSGIGRTEPLEAGDVLIWPPGVPYRFCFPAGEERHYVLMNFDFDDSGWGESSRHPVEERFYDKSQMFSSYAPPPFGGICRVSGAGEIAGILREVCTAQERGGVRCGEITSALTRAALLCCATRMTEESGAADASHELAARVRAYVDGTDIAEPITAGSAARALSYHPYYISRVFAQRYGMPLQAYMIRRRVEAAMVLLASTDLPMGEIAARCGFGSAAYFSEIFRRETGMRPTEYRAQNR